MANYLYNGVELPALPEWDKETYPYVVMHWNTQGSTITTVTLVAYSEPMHLVLNTPSVGNKYYLGVKAGEKYLYSRKYKQAAQFPAFKESTLTYDYMFTNEPSWSNYDIYDKDGTLYLAASDPIPVGPAPEVEPKSFMAGWRMGQIVRAMRMNSPGITPPEEEKIPIGFSYNGVVLPNIDTVWTDKTKYLYAYLSRVRMQNGDEVRDGYYLTLSNTRAYVSTTLIVGMWMVPTGSVVQQYFMDVNGSTYTLEMTSEHTEVFTEIALPAHITDEVQEYNCLWASVDICGENDSTIYLAASEPVPVYE